MERTVFRSTSMGIVSAIALAVAWLATPTFGQPAPPPPPPGVIDLGDVGVPEVVVSPEVQLNAGGIVWFRLNLTSPITRLGTWMDLDTAMPNGITNNMMVVYNEWAFRVGEDNDSGGGSTDWSAAMSIGAGSGLRLSRELGGRNSDGAWGWYAPGVYYVGVIGWINNFNGWFSPNRTWDYNTNSTISGLTRLTIRTGVAPSTFWNERYHEGGNSSVATTTAMEVRGSGSLTTLVCTFNPGEREGFKIRICNPAAFQAVAVPSIGGGGLFRARMFLLDESGRGVVGINNTIAGTATTLNGVPSMQPGEYYLIIGSYCGGANGFDSVPYDANYERLWNFSGNHDVSIPPNGPGAANPMVLLGSQAVCDGVSSTDTYYARISLSGVCYIPEGTSGCPDLNGDGTIGLQDLTIFLAAFGSVCP